MDAGLQTAAKAPLTTTMLILIAIGALCAIAIIVWGTYLRRRSAAELAESEAHAALAEQAMREEAAEQAAEPPQAPTDATEHADDAIGATPPPSAIPDAPPTSDPATPASPAADPLQALTRLKGLGPKVAAQLESLGITRIDQLAALSTGEAEALDARLGAFAGRIGRDRWCEQAQLLAAGDIAGFEARFGKLGG
ncbi:MAG: hypothetical protein B7Y45_04170 [Sphingomonas sp. 28-66-16]|nr:MAG: hypothetical protein B7Y45_04170 [Sphingomonas sp. 28-66-16]